MYWSGPSRPGLYAIIGSLVNYRNSSDDVYQYIRDIITSGNQWRSQDLILGGAVKNNVRGSEATEPERAERARGGGGRLWVSPSHSESFLHFDVVNGAIWCICPVFSTYSMHEVYLILLWKWLKGGSFTRIHATLFSFFFSLSLPPVFWAFGGREATAPTAPPPWLRACR